MRSRRLAPLLVILIACAQDPGPVPGSRGLVLLGSPDGVTRVDAGDGSVLSTEHGVSALDDPLTVFRTASTPGGSVLETRDAVRGAISASVPIKGALEVRVASSNASLVALMPPMAAGEQAWVPVPRRRTTIVVADPTGGGDPRTYRLHGNFEPEAFTPDGDGLFMVRYVPPMDPVAYRVSRLDLDSGDVQPVYTGSKSVVETMSGTRLEQVSSRRGSMLYTLYSTASASGPHHHGGADVRFVHTLALDQGWAHCIALPKAFWGGDARTQAMAVSLGGNEVYIADTARGVVATLDANHLKVTKIRRLGLGAGPEGDTHAVVLDYKLFVAAGAVLTRVDPDTLAVEDRIATDGVVTGLGTHEDRLVVATTEGVVEVDPKTGKVTRTTPAQSVEGLTYVGLTEPVRTSPAPG